MENPCKKCITLAVCKSRANDKPIAFILWASTHCPLYRGYITDDNNQINFIKANELGKIFGHEIESRK